MKIGKLEFSQKLKSLEEYLIAADNPVGKKQLRPFLRRKRNRIVLTREQVTAIKLGRRVLRAEMKARGLRRWSDFEETATNLGLYFDRKGLLWPFFLWLMRDNTVAKILATTAVLTTVVTVTQPVIEYVTEYVTEYITQYVTEYITEYVTEYITEYITEEKDRFTISLTDEMFTKGFELCEEPDFKDPKEVLVCLPAEGVPCITIADIPAEIVDSPGGAAHDTYFAYTFYCRYIDKDATAAVETEDFDLMDYATSYDWALRIANEGLDITQENGEEIQTNVKVSDAIWVMVIKDGEVILRAKKRADGTTELLPDNETVQTRKVAFADWSEDHINEVLALVYDELAVKPSQMLTMDNYNKLETLFTNKADLEDCKTVIKAHFEDTGVSNLTQLMMQTSNWRDHYKVVGRNNNTGRHFYQVEPEDFFQEDPVNKQNIVSRTEDVALPYIDRDGMRNYHKYTVVFWLEGNDPDCTNALMNGHIGMNFQIKGEAENYMDEIITSTDPTEATTAP